MRSIRSHCRRIDASRDSLLPTDWPLFLATLQMASFADAGDGKASAVTPEEWDGALRAAAGDFLAALEAPE